MIKSGVFATGGFLLGAIAVALSASTPSSRVKSFHIGVGRAASKKMEATSLSVSRIQACASADGSATLVVKLVGTDGHIIAQRGISFPSNRSTPVVDSLGNVLSPSVSKEDANTIDSFNTTWDARLEAIANSGFFNF